MQQDLLSADELLGNIDSFTIKQRTARETFIEQELHLPREWLCEDGCGVDASPAGRVATSIYNTVVESGATDPRFSNSSQMTGSFAGIIDCVWFGSSLPCRLQAREARLDIGGLDGPRVVIDQPRQIAGFRRRQFADRYPGNNCRMGRDSILNLVEGRQPEAHRTILPGRIDAVHAQPQSRTVALLCEFNGLAGDGLGFAFHQGLGGHGNAVASAFRLAAGISGLSFLKGH